MKIKISLLPIFLIISITSYSQDFTLSRIQAESESLSMAVVYSLPQTSLQVTLEIIKNSYIKGPYAEFAKKFLDLADVIMDDSEVWSISAIECKPINEPDPAHYFGLFFKTIPDNLNSLNSLNDHGILLSKPESVIDYKILPISNVNNENLVIDPLLIEETQKVRTDTFYKTIMNDTAFVRIPVFKKQVLAKNQEELAKETAHELIKTRKRRIKFIRGEYDFHPDAATLSLMIKEMEKQENIYLQLFKGVKTQQKYKYTFSIMPSKNLESIDLGYFSKENGFSKEPAKSSGKIMVHFQKDGTPVESKIVTDGNLQKNTIIYRVPQFITVIFSSGEKEISKVRVPFYQFGFIQSFNLKLK